MVDRYTKGVLTGIAICLAMIAFRQYEPIDRPKLKTVQRMSLSIPLHSTLSNLRSRFR